MSDRLTGRLVPRLARASARNARTQPMRRTNGTSTQRAGRHAGRAPRARGGEATTTKRQKKAKDRREGDNTHSRGVGRRAVEERATAIGGMGKKGCADLLPGHR